MESLKVKVVQSFSFVLQILLPFGVSLITSIGISVITFFALKKARKKEEVYASHKISSGNGKNLIILGFYFSHKSFHNFQLFQFC